MIATAPRPKPAHAIMRQSTEQVLSMQLSRSSGLLAAIFLLASCASSDAPDGSGGAAPPPASFVAVPFVSAHRGGAAYAPENTMLAYENAARLGVDDFEADMLVTAESRQPAC